MTVSLLPVKLPPIVSASNLSLLKTWLPSEIVAGPTPSPLASAVDLFPPKIVAQLLKLKVSAAVIVKFFILSFIIYLLS